MPHIRTVSVYREDIVVVALIVLFVLFFDRYTEVINITGAAGKNHFLQSIIESDNEMLVPLPDYSQMIPYKPKTNPLPGEHPVSGENKLHLMLSCFVHLSCVQ